LAERIFRSAGASDESFKKHRAYIANNPVKSGLVDAPEKYPYSFENLAKKKAKAQRVPAARDE
jgi:hypothetical protein